LATEVAAGVRLACLLRPDRDLSIRVPESTAAGDLQVTVHGDPKTPKADGPLGLAVDLGTTTLAATLVSLGDGATLASGSTMNPQVRFGGDVMTRIDHGSTAEGLHELKTAAQRGITRLFESLCRAVSCPAGDIERVVLGGNTAMLQILAGVDPSPLGQSPFTVGLEGGKDYPAEHFGLPLADGCRVYVPPVMHAFCGPDISIGLLAIESLRVKGPTLFMDIGTNGELALEAGGRRLVTSAAAGPAFEGMGLACGSIARPGAVDAAWTGEGDLRVRTVAHASVNGICGSGAVDLMAALYRLRALERSGRMLESAETQAFRPDLAVRLQEIEDTPVVVIGPGVYLSQHDIRQLQLAKAAIRTAVDMLLSEAGVQQVDRVVLAGGFGHTLRPTSLEAIGMLPPGFAARVEHAGNTCLRGGVLLLQNPEARDRIEAKAAAAEHVVLVGQAEYMDRFVDQMELPEKAAAIDRPSRSNRAELVEHASL